MRERQLYRTGMDLPPISTRHAKAGKLEAIELPEGVLLKRVEQRPSMLKVDGLWVHQGSAEPGANWKRILARKLDKAGVDRSILLVAAELSVELLYDL